MVDAPNVPLNDVAPSDWNQATLPVNSVPLPPVVTEDAARTGAVTFNAIAATGFGLKVKVTGALVAAS